MFKCLRIALCGVGPKQRAVLRDNVARVGGEIVDLSPPPVFPLFKASASVPTKTVVDHRVSSLSHIISEERSVPLASLLRELAIDELPPLIPIVHVSWITDSLKQNKLLDDTSYRITPSITPCTTLKRKAEEAVSTDSVNQKDSRKYDDVSPIGFDSWSSVDGCHYRLSSSSDSFSRILGLDLDSTLIKTKSGKTFPVDESDWTLFSASVPRVLRQMHEEGYHIAIMSNQSGLSNGKVDIKQLRRKVEAVCDAIGLPMDFICSYKRDGFRKPRTGMWDLLLRLRGVNSADLNIGGSVYAGDAAGRGADKGRGRRRDHSDADRLFALNVGCQFRTPESLFLASADPADNVFGPPASQPLSHLRNDDAVDSTLFEVLSPRRLEVVLLVAPAACGKSTIARKMVSHTRINQDSLKTLKACLQRAKDILGGGESVVVDNTNLSVDVRAQWIALARSMDIDIRCVRLHTPKAVAMLLRTYRLCNPHSAAEDRREIMDVTLHTQYKNMQEPEMSEGFFRLDFIPFVFEEAVNEDERRLQNTYL